MSRPVCIDFYCCGGGASVGYHRAGFDVYGVEQAPTKGRDPAADYPFPLHVGDAIAALDALLAGETVEFNRPRHRPTTGRVLRLDDVAAVVGSPPCHDHSALSSLSGLDGSGELLEQTRERFRATGLPYVIENVEGAPLASASDLFGTHGVLLCGSMFGLGATCRDGKWRYLERHRLFESNVPLSAPSGCRHSGQAVGVYGTGGGGQMTRGYKAHPEEAREALGIDWTADRWALSQSIPPRMTEHIGWQLLQHLAAEVAA